MSCEKLMQIYNILLQHYGNQHWWPGQTTLEIIIGAILTQNTSWKNVEKAIKNIRAQNELSFDQLNSKTTDQIAKLIKPAGYYNLKAKRLKNFLNWLSENHAGKLDSLAPLDTETLRSELLAINGIGPETADSIILYAFEKPAFVVDTYTCRIMARHLLIDLPCDYHQLQELFTSSLQPDPKLFNEFHALLVRLAKEHCRKKPLCNNCPLQHLPHETNPETF